MGSAPSRNNLAIEEGVLKQSDVEMCSKVNTNTHEIEETPFVTDTAPKSSPMTSNEPSGGEVNQAGESEMTSGNKNEPNECLKETEEFQKYRNETFGRLRTLSVKILHINNKLFADDEETFTKIKTELRFIYGLYFSAEKKGVLRQVYESYQKELCDVLLELDLLNEFVKILEVIPRDVDFTSATADQMRIMMIIMGILHNCTDISDAFANAVARADVMLYIKEILVANYNENITKSLEQTSEMIIGNCHGIAHNTSMREVNVERLRDLDYTSTLAPYLKSPVRMVRISVLATLANIVTEKECEIISNHILVVAQLLMLLNEGMTTESRRCNGWSCRECALAVRQLARNDANKKLLHELKALQSLVELAKSKDEEEQLESILAILALSFDDKIRVDITTQETFGVIDTLLDLKATSKNNNIKNACEKTLWNLKDDLLLSSIPSYKAAGERMQQKNGTDTKTGHVMISYQRNDREFLVTVKERLKECGYKVWMDVDEMGGCVYETMADAVENANVFLMCYCRKYKESENCQYEAKYAHKRKKAVIPLKMERDYEPDGWLGLLLKSDYFIEFSGKYDNEKKLVELIAHIRKIWPTGQDYVDAPIILKEQQPVLATRTPEVGGAPTKRQNTRELNEKPDFSCIVLVKAWNKDDVNKWLENNGLKNQGLDRICGLEISYLARLLIEAPEQLHHCLRKDLKIKTLSTKAKIVWALQDLVNMEKP